LRCNPLYSICSRLEQLNSFFKARFLQASFCQFTRAKPVSTEQGWISEYPERFSHFQKKFSSFLPSTVLTVAIGGG